MCGDAFTKDNTTTDDERERQQSAIQSGTRFLEERCKAFRDLCNKDINGILSDGFPTTTSELAACYKLLNTQKKDVYEQFKQVYKFDEEKMSKMRSRNALHTRLHSMAQSPRAISGTAPEHRRN